ncbi:MAG: hypothetical protein K2M70_06310, partial [Lachnospiraceae bacterium]|nr:hypothetical protein [Lachnospiraceae bacterium]
DQGEMESLFAQMEEAMENLDMDAMEEAIQEMNHYSYDDSQQKLFEELKNAVEDIDTEACEKIIAEWREKLGE